MSMKWVTCSIFSGGCAAHPQDGVERIPRRGCRSIRIAAAFSFLYKPEEYGRAAPIGLGLSEKVLLGPFVEICNIRPTKL
jgi:hypothetical protein